MMDGSTDGWKDECGVKYWTNVTVIDQRANSLWKSHIISPTCGVNINNKVLVHCLKNKTIDYF